MWAVNDDEEEFHLEEEKDEFYDEENVFWLLENDEINDAEEGFMVGYMGS